MGRYDVSSESDAFAALRAAHGALGAQLEQPHVNLVKLAKAYQALATAMAAVAVEAGHGSLRFDAVVRALDLRTPKSALRAFLEG